MGQLQASMAVALKLQGEAAGLAAAEVEAVPAASPPAATAHVARKRSPRERSEKRFDNIPTSLAGVGVIRIRWIVAKGARGMDSRNVIRTRPFDKSATAIFVCQDSPQRSPLTHRALLEMRLASHWLGLASLRSGGRFMDRGPASLVIDDHRVD